MELERSRRNASWRAADGVTMPASTPRLPARSAPTLTCFTAAIAQRDGAHVLGSSYARNAAATSRAADPARRAEAAGRSSARAPLSPPRRAREPELRARSEAPPRRKALPWRVACAFAVGASLAALGGLATDVAGVELAALSCAIAGGITLAAAVSGRR
jgi:hypothetical protein